jgi:ABC-2 type transport system permease protein
MLRGLWKLTWLELKIFMREPLGAFGTVAVPVLFYVLAGRAVGSPRRSSSEAAVFAGVQLPVLATLLIALSAVISLITIISIYREGGILKRLRATPLRPVTILTAHVLVKLLLTSATLILMALAGRRFYPAGIEIPLVPFAIALVIGTWAVLSVGFLIASIVPTARFAQPIAAVIFYPMIALSGLFYPVSAFSPGLRLVARAMPLTYVVSLLVGVLEGDPWSSHVGDLAALAVVFVLCTVLSSRVFRWE